MRQRVTLAGSAGALTTVGLLLLGAPVALAAPDAPSAGAGPDAPTLEQPRQPS